MYLKYHNVTETVNSLLVPRVRQRTVGNHSLFYKIHSSIIWPVLKYVQCLVTVTVCLVSVC